MVRVPVAVINETTILEEDDVDTAVLALQEQVKEFSEVWPIDATLRFISKSERPPKESWWLVILDDADDGNVLGYHELNSRGLPLSKVFAGTDTELGIPWTLTASHELLEMLADPNIKSAAAISTPYGQFNYAREVCDACEAEAFGYTITVSGDREVLVSDFLYPTWFDPAKDISTDGFDKEGHVKSPFQCLPGCHMDVYDVNRGAWRTFWGEGQPYRYEPQPVPGTRRAHRRRPPSHWRNSTLVVRGAIE